MPGPSTIRLLASMAERDRLGHFTSCSLLMNWQCGALLARSLSDCLPRRGTQLMFGVERGMRTEARQGHLASLLEDSMVRNLVKHMHGPPESACDEHLPSLWGTKRGWPRRCLITATSAPYPLSYHSASMRTHTPPGQMANISAINKCKSHLQDVLVAMAADRER